MKSVKPTGDSTHPVHSATFPPIVALPKDPGLEPGSYEEYDAYLRQPFMIGGEEPVTFTIGEMLLDVEAEIQDDLWFEGVA